MSSQACQVRQIVLYRNNYMEVDGLIFQRRHFYYHANLVNCTYHSTLSPSRPTFLWAQWRCRGGGGGWGAFDPVFGEGAFPPRTIVLTVLCLFLFQSYEYNNVHVMPPPPKKKNNNTTLTSTCTCPPPPPPPSSPIWKKNWCCHCMDIFRHIAKCYGSKEGITLRGERSEYWIRHLFWRSVDENQSSHLSLATFSDA